MKVLSLRCTHGHGFEGWFGSEDEYRSQNDRGLVECPLCGDAQITRLPTAARFNRSSGRSVPMALDQQPEPKPQSMPARTTPERQSVEALWIHAVRHVMTHTDDVGTRFADEARRIHYGEVPQRAIRGQATAEQTEALRDEGIEVHALPVPEVLKEPLQ